MFFVLCFDVVVFGGEISQVEWVVCVDFVVVYCLVVFNGWDDFVYIYLLVIVLGELDYFLINVFGLVFDEIIVFNFVKINGCGQFVGDWFDVVMCLFVNVMGFVLYVVVYVVWFDVYCVIYLYNMVGIVVLVQRWGLLMLFQYVLWFY